MRPKDDTFVATGNVASRPHNVTPPPALPSEFLRNRYAEDVAAAVTRRRGPMLVT